jgi:hypothetical protein
MLACCLWEANVASLRAAAKRNLHASCVCLNKVSAPSMALVASCRLEEDGLHLLESLRGIDALRWASIRCSVVKSCRNKTMRQGYFQCLL